MFISPPGHQVFHQRLVLLGLASACQPTCVPAATVAKAMRGRDLWRPRPSLLGVQLQRGRRLHDTRRADLWHCLADEALEGDKFASGLMMQGYSAKSRVKTSHSYSPSATSVNPPQRLWLLDVQVTLSEKRRNVTVFCHRTHSGQGFNGG